MLDKNKREKTEISMDYSILVRKVFSLCISYEVLYLLIHQSSKYYTYKK